MRAVCVGLVLVVAAGCGKVVEPTTAPKESAIVEPKGAAPVEPKQVSPAGVPWDIEAANKKLVGKTKEQVIALLGKPDDLGGAIYWYNRRIYLAPDIGAKDTTPNGMRVDFNDGGKVIAVYRIDP